MSLSLSTGIFKALSIFLKITECSALEMRCISLHVFYQAFCQYFGVFSITDIFSDAFRKKNPSLQQEIS
jgi:hypothetical protein